MAIVIYQEKTIDPMHGGINRMSTVYRDIFTEAGFQVFYLSSLDDGSSPLENQLYIEGHTDEEKKDSFISIIRKYNIQLMIYQEGINPLNNYILRWARYSNIKIINVIHSTLKGMYGIDGRPLLSRIKPKFLKQIVTLCVNRYFIRKYGKLYREEFKLSDRVVLLSDKYKNEITYFTGWKDFAKFSYITNPVTLKGFKPTECKKKIVVHVGLLTSSKRQDILLKVWKLIEKEKTDWILKIIGDGEKRCFLEKAAASLKLRNIEFLGYQAPEKYYKEASIFCLTSGFESFGLVLVESMAYGCVPMAFNSFETASDIIDNGKNGILVPPFNIKEYAKSLLSLMNDDNNRKQMSYAAYMGSQNFSKEIISEKWINLVEQLNVKS